MIAAIESGDVDKVNEILTKQVFTFTILILFVFVALVVIVLRYNCIFKAELLICKKSYTIRAFTSNQ